MSLFKLCPFKVSKYLDAKKYVDVHFFSEIPYIVNARVSIRRIDLVTNAMGTFALALKVEDYTPLRLLGSFLRAILKAEWSPIILSRGFSTHFRLSKITKQF